VLLRLIVVILLLLPCSTVFLWLPWSCVILIVIVLVLLRWSCLFHCVGIVIHLLILLWYCCDELCDTIVVVIQYYLVLTFDAEKMVLLLLVIVIVIIVLMMMVVLLRKFVIRWCGKAGFEYRCIDIEVTVLMLHYWCWCSDGIIDVGMWSTVLLLFCSVVRVFVV